MATTDRMSTRRPHYSKWYARGQAAAAVIGLALLAAGLLWIGWLGTRGGDARDGALCARLYRAAHTAADTIHVDQLWPSPQRGRARNTGVPLRCGALRAAGRVPF